jgi:hypothetical protein
MPKFEFNPDGSLKLPAKVMQARDEHKKKIAQADSNPKILVKLVDEDHGKCIWEFKLPETISFGSLVAINKWVNTVHKDKLANAYLDRDEGTIRISMSGPSKCLICRAFLNGLQTKVLDEKNTLIKQANVCSKNFYIKFVY